MVFGQKTKELNNLPDMSMNRNSQKQPRKRITFCAERANLQNLNTGLMGHSSLSQLSFSLIFPHKILLYCSFNSAKVKELFSLSGSVGLNGFYSVKVKGFIPIGAVCADKIWTVYISAERCFMKFQQLFSILFILVFRCRTYFYITTRN